MSKLVLVTGGAGFVGSHLCGRLAAAGHRVISLDNYFAGSKENHVPGVDYREGHTKDIAALIPETPDLIYHLGEYSRVEQSVLEPDIVYDLNVVGTTAVLAYWQDRKCKLVYAGSSTKFGDGGAARYTSPYAETKAANSERVRDIGEQTGLPYAITYFYNVFGPGERAGVYGSLIENFRRMRLRGVPLCVVAPGTQMRNFTHVDDIVDGLIVIGERGRGEYGLGNEASFSVLDVAAMFGGPIVLMPARAGNRMSADIDTAPARALGWRAQRSLRSYIETSMQGVAVPANRESRVLVFATTFFPHEGRAEKALRILADRLPDVQFDVVTTVFSKASGDPAHANIHVHRVGYGMRFDKYLLPIAGFLAARRLHRRHAYLFAWSILASYGALAAALLRRMHGVPLLITLADQDFTGLSWARRTFLRHIITGADQIYAMSASQEAHAGSTRRSLGDGDAFANNIRFAYEQVFREHA